ncbi:MAG: electron transport complex subunit RsxA [Peptoniphilus sp.]|uniref:Ion-translocating oxidoreductase complex subunit A n=2 Tax=Peptoniphilus indolicus TaxID=33030 RepID=G4D5Y7_9FIRM|nr:MULTISPECIES: electron transport complex subunit RsxA [Peptoniphilus]EGY78033.1 Na(+)-translocating NADH-quinone reductase subunit E [Peptoniphilus indolicus ATCC 29427]MDY2987167.1 electron transport complex subunit RsxA [Peptoniphilus sp.]SUB76197.1 Electron transport complex protein rnfA [Peptoniphilus indolicus]
MLGSIITILVSTILVNNYIFAQFLGICPFLGVSSKVETATGMGIAVTFVVVIASAITWCLQTFILDKFGLGYLQTIMFILVIASLVQFVEMVIKKLSPSLYTAMGVFLPLITTNCMVLGVTVLNVQNGYNLIETVISGLGASIGFTIALVLIAALRERLVYAKVPKALQGVPIALISAGLMALAFSGFSGLV